MKTIAVFSATAMVAAAPLFAARTPADWTDSVKKALVVYDNKDTFVQKVRFAWMEQFQMADVQPNGGNGKHLKPGAGPFNQEFRRSWVGVNVSFASGTEFHTWARIGGLPAKESYPGGRTKKNYTYTDLFDIWVKQNISSVKGLSVKGGKIKPLFTTDYSIPSSAIPCIERSILANQYNAPDSNWGVEVNWEPDKENKVYVQLLANDRACNAKNMKHTDVYRDGRGLKGEFGWEDKCFGIIGAEHKFKVTESGYHKVSAQYMHDFDNTYRTHVKQGSNYYGFGFQDALSLGYEVKKNKLALITNLVASFEQQGGNGTNNIGWEIEPIYTLHPHVDLVMRYVGIVGDGACKLGADRYISSQVDTATWADSVHTLYFGANFYASAKNKNALKFMLGAEYTTARRDGADCYNGWTYSSAVRWSF